VGITDVVLRNISECTSLRKLNLTKIDCIQDTSFECFANLSQLSELYLNLTDISSQALSIFGKLPQLKKLHLIGCEIENIDDVSHIPNLLFITKVIVSMDDLLNIL
jgi:Leucine-rich repeat (LRR) protein